LTCSGVPEWKPMISRIDSARQKRETSFMNG